MATPPSLPTALSCVSALLLPDSWRVYVRLTPLWASLAWLEPHCLLSLSPFFCTQAYTPQQAPDSRMIVRSQPHCINSFIMFSKLPTLTRPAFLFNTIR